MTKCWKCGATQMNNEAATARRIQTGPLFSVRKVERDPDTIRLVDIPRKHGFDAALVFGGIAGLLSGNVVAGCACGLAAFGVARATAGYNATKLLWEIETAFGVDLDGNGYEGEPDSQPDKPAQSRTNYLPIKGPVKSSGKYSKDDRLHLENVARFVEQCEIIGTSVSAWVDNKRVKPEFYYELRTALIKAGWAAWKNPDHKNLGWELLYTADEIKRRIMEGVPPTPQQGEW